MLGWWLPWRHPEKCLTFTCQEETTVMVQSNFRIGISVILVSVWMAAPASAQTERGAIVGVVKDAGGGVRRGEG